MTGQPEFSPEVVLKAERLLGKTVNGTPAVLRDPEHPSVWWVTPSSGAAKRYRVQSDYGLPGATTLSWITCSCPHGINKGGGTTRCYHAAAVLMLIRDEMTADVHSPYEGQGGGTECICGWPSKADFAAHVKSWVPDFSEHLLSERRKI